ncbi:MAG: hypothetical protein RIG63_21780 [Coleofasciculus chthonoplastes F3-SA18-01]|uniref:hypothetical protein n=1 Tax=Coleofasciculus chthonoplastes TaxID=64178 RepID=UPI003301B5DA
MTSYPKRGSTVNPGKLPRCDRATRNPPIPPLHSLAESWLLFPPTEGAIASTTASRQGS